ncbi:unnamed protein product, partial [Discosporangium mesarthrocarpum]
DSHQSGLWKGAGVATPARPKRHPVILVLDEELQALPWEGLPCLRGHPVTRTPALPFVFSATHATWGGHGGSNAGGGGGDNHHRKGDGEADAGTAAAAEANAMQGLGLGLRGKETAAAAAAAAAAGSGPWIPARDGIRMERAFYVLDPESNLPSTRRELGPIFARYEKHLGWTGVAGRVPAEGWLERSLVGADLFAYCGHGAGELLLGRDTAAALPRSPVAVLMGCSSGRLKGHGEFEPSGMVSGYLVGGSPAVVANLWDVTDRDIDRFSVALLWGFV